MFVRSGYINYDGHISSNGGANAYFWSTHVNTNAGFQYSFHLDFNPSGVDPSRNNRCFWAFPLRCLVR